VEWRVVKEEGRNVAHKRYIDRGIRGAESHTVYYVHDKTNLRSVGSTGEVRVDLLGVLLVERYEPIENVHAGGVVVIATCY